LIAVIVAQLPRPASQPRGNLICADIAVLHA